MMSNGEVAECGPMWRRLVLPMKILGLILWFGVLNHISNTKYVNQDYYRMKSRNKKVEIRKLERMKSRKNEK